jgi:2-polyprenyl-3-methyl-5-hydroxy-6-metoxy-1,4-benzoquinol methylase
VRAEHLPLLVAPGARPLRLEDAETEGDEVISGRLVDGSGTEVPIRAGIPRFVADEGYAASFGRQWEWYRRVQVEGETARRLTRERFEATTGWTPVDLAGSLVLEAGCGAGRFTQLLVDSGARVCAIDYSEAVDAARETVGAHERLLLAQADLAAAPFREASFDRVLCLGVLQHTPNPRAAFLRLVPFVRPGGEIVVDVYVKRRRPNRWSSKYWVRPLTRRLRPALLRRAVEWYVPRWLPLDTRLERVPRVGPLLVSVVPCWNYTNVLPLDPAELEAWAVLDTFDALSARYDAPQTLGSVREWFEAAGLEDVEVRLGGNGIVGRGRRSR